MERKYKYPVIHKPEVIDFILSNYKGNGPKSMTEMVNREFSVNITVDQIKNFYSRHHLNSGVTGYFEKGHTPANKGKSFEEIFKNEEARNNVKKGWFKKGHTVFNHVEIGKETIRKTVGGRKPYVWVKVAEPNKWQMKHRYLYEKYHNVKLKNSDIVTFLDGDIYNFNKDNLCLIGRGINAGLNRWKKRTTNPELNQASINYLKLCDAITKKEKNLEKENKNGNA